MSQTIEVDLRGGGLVTLIVEANLLTMDTADRQFVFGLVDAFHDYDSQQEAERPSAVSPEGYELGAGHAEWLHGVGHGALDIEPEPAPPVTSETIAPEPSEPYPFACDRCGHEAAGPKSLESHEATCRVPFRSFVCPFCQRSDFGTPQALGAHKRYKHAGEVAA